MKFGKLRKVTGFWKNLFFMGNVCKMRKALILYLAGEGIRADLCDGLVVFDYASQRFIVGFDEMDGYAECCLCSRYESEDYKQMEDDDKAFMAARINSDENVHAVVQVFEEYLIVQSSFCFSSKQMMLDLFCLYFQDLAGKISAAKDEISDYEPSKPAKRIGFYIDDNENSNTKQTNEVAAREKISIKN